jgi:hypothetical protein
VLESCKGKAFTIMKILQPVDLAIAWLGYLHLIEFKTLPAHYHDNRTAKPSRIVCKDPRPLQWKINETVKTKDLLSGLFKEAFSSVSACLAESPADPNKVLAPLYLSAVHMHKQLNK